MFGMRGLVLKMVTDVLGEMLSAPSNRAFACQRRRAELMKVEAQPATSSKVLSRRVTPASAKPTRPSFGMVVRRVGRSSVQFKYICRCLIPALARSLGLSCRRSTRCTSAMNGPANRRRRSPTLSDLTRGDDELACPPLPLRHVSQASLETRRNRISQSLQLGRATMGEEWGMARRGTTNEQNREGRSIASGTGSLVSLARLARYSAHGPARISWTWELCPSTLCAPVPQPLHRSRSRIALNVCRATAQRGS